MSSFVSTYTVEFYGLPLHKGLTKTLNLQAGGAEDEIVADPEPDLPSNSKDRYE